MSGFFGVVSKKDCTQDLFYGTDYHSHLGTEFAGIATLSAEGFYHQIHNISHSQFKSKFFEDFKKNKGTKGIGVISAKEEQPIYVQSRFGPLCIATVGLIENAKELTEEILNKGMSFSQLSKGESANTSELVAKLIIQGKDLVDGIEKMFSRIKGSCSLLILNQEGIYAARDRKGYTPILVGKKDDAWAVASETSAFLNNGFQIDDYLKPGEIILLNEEGINKKRPGQAQKQICAFLWIYTGFPASHYEGINVELVRERCGRCLARRDKVIDADMVTGVPDSGIAHALGYAMESGKPFRRPLVKYTPGYGRSYTPPSQEIRDLVAKMKLIPIRELIQNKSIVLCEDSIVRGTQLKNFTITKLWDCQAREVHVRPACPPLLFPCKFNLSTRSIEELAARKAIFSIEARHIEDVAEYLNPQSKKYQQMVEWIRKNLGVTTLRYQFLEDMVEAIGLPKEQLCLYCWTGEEPKERPQMFLEKEQQVLAKEA